MSLSIEEASLIKIIRSSIHEQPCELVFDEIDWNKLLRLANRHQLSMMVGHILTSNYSDFPLKKEFMEETHRAMILDAQQQRLMIDLEKLFKENDIRYSFLKGNFIKDAYPHRFYRWMTDIDILIDPAKRELVHELFTQQDFTAKTYKIDNHDIYFNSLKLVVEIHVYLFDDHFAALRKAFTPIEAEMLQQENNVLNQYLFFIAHHIKHSISSGMGIRNILDFYLVSRAYSDQLDMKQVDTAIEDWGYLEEYHRLVQLSEDWFGTENKETSDLQLQEMIIQSTVHGDVNSRTKNFMKEQENNKWRLILTRTFPDLRTMQTLDPFLKKAPILLPYSWGKRLILSLFKKSDIVSSEIQSISKYKADQSEKD